MPTSYSEQVLADGAVAYWRLNETSGTTAASLVPGVPAGTISGAVTLNQPGAIADGDKAMRFNPAGAADGTVNLTNGAWNAFGTAAFAVEAWIRGTTMPSAHQLMVAAGATTGGAGSASLTVHPTGLYWWVVDSAAVQLSIGTPVAPVLDGRWHYVVGVRRVGSPNDSLELWVDGVLAASTTMSTGRNYTALAPSFIGGGVANEFLGEVDEVAVYKTALTPAQIAAHYYAGLGPYAAQVVQDGAVAYWRLNETSGTVAASTVGNFPGTISGAVALNQPSAMPDGSTAMAFTQPTGDIRAVTGAYQTIGTGPVSIECWFKTNRLAQQWLVDLKQAGNPNAYGVGLYIEANGAVSFNAAGPGSGILLRTAASSTSDDRWHHVVGVVDRVAARLLVYVDGVLVVGGQTVVPAGVDLTASFPMTMGAFAGDAASSALHFTGSLDDVALYHKALTPAEIAAHHLLGRGVAVDSYGSQVLADGAVAYWRLGETSGTVARDVLGSAHGTITGGVTLGQPGALVDSDKAMAFDGSTGQIGTTATIKLAQAFSVELWFQGPAHAAQVPLWSNRTASPTTGSGFFGISAGGQPFLFMDNQTPPAMTGPPFLRDGKWHHLVYTHDGVTTGRMFVDGVQAHSASIGRVTTGGATPAFIGREAAGGSAVSGLIDEVAIYPTALTPTQIAAHYVAAKQSRSWPGVPWWVQIQGENALDSYNVWEPITPSNTVNLPRGVTGGIWVGSGGDVAAVMQNNVMPVVLAAVPTGAWLPIAATRINATGTTATGLVALYEQ